MWTHCILEQSALLQDVPQNSNTQHGGAGLILLGRGKRLLYIGREFAPSGTEVFRNHRKFPAIFTMKKGRMCMVGSNSVPLTLLFLSSSPRPRLPCIKSGKIYSNKYRIKR
jgi:hypothetical protein